MGLEPLPLLLLAERQLMFRHLLRVAHGQSQQAQLLWMLL
jgi:hypothetical protein